MNAQLVIVHFLTDKKPLLVFPDDQETYWIYGVPVSFYFSVEKIFCKSCNYSFILVKSVFVHLKLTLSRLQKDRAGNGKRLTYCVSALELESTIFLVPIGNY